MARSTFYKPLTQPDGIRLCLVHPGSPGSVLKCCLIPTTLSECDEDIYEQYTALSYVWGNQKEKTIVYVNGEPVSVTANLAAALDDLRDGHRILRIWVDALCINQTDLRERNWQVGLMREIYSLANQTVIYLGALNELCESFLMTLRASRMDYSEDFAAAAVDILSRQWFTRVWIFQELVLSKKVWVQCGRSRVKWEQFCSGILDEGGHDARIDLVSPGKLDPKRVDSGISVFSEKSSTGLELGRLQSMLSNMKQARANLTRPALGHILLSRRGFGATDPRDLIYGHLAVAGLHATRDPLHCPVVDYTKSIADVFTDGAICSIRSMKNDLSLLLHVDVRDSGARRKDLPSWVPDWTLDSSHYLNPTPPSQHWSTNSYTLNELVARDLQIMPSFPQPDVLAFMSVRLARIEVINDSKFGPSEDWSEGDAEMCTVFDSSESGVERNNRQVEIYRERYSSLGSILSEEFLPPLPKDDYLITLPAFRNIWNTLNKFLINPSIAKESFQEVLMKYAFGLDETSFIPGRKAAILSSSLSNSGFCLVPTNTEVGDEIYLLKCIEANHCVVLRPVTNPVHDDRVVDKCNSTFQGSEKRHYRFVGVAWMELLDNMEQRLTAEFIQRWKETYLDRVVVVLH